MPTEPHQDVRLLLIDLQRAYFRDSSLAQERDRLVEACGHLLRWARSVGVGIVNIRTQHERDGSTWTLNMLEDGQGFAFRGDDDALPLEELDLRGATDVVKTRDDAFLGTGLDEVLAGSRTLVVAGVSTHTCVAATVAHAYALGWNVVLVRDALASHRPDLHLGTVEALSDEYRLPVLDVAAVLAGALDELPRRGREGRGIRA